jgi:hypothetical protein
MSYHYIPGAVRWKRYTGPADVRLYRAPKGWDACAMVIDYHPTTDRRLPQAQWWIRETYTGD